MPIHQGISSSEVLTSGVVFNVNDIEHASAGYESDSSQSDTETAGAAGAHSRYFKNLAKLTAGAGTLTDLCQGTEDADDSIDCDNLPPFEALRVRMTDLVGDGGIMKLVRVPGAGPQIQPGCHARLHYTGQFEAQDEPFDSTYLRGRGSPQSHRVGPNSELFSGLNLAVLSMRKGEESLFLISPQYAYGEMGCAPRIPANSEVLFRVLLLSWTDSREVDEFNELTEEERLKASFQKRMSAIRCAQHSGNTQYGAGDHRAAAKTYREAIRIYESMVFANDAEHSEAKHVIFKVMSNRTQTLLCLNQWKEAARQGRQALNHSDEEEDTPKYILYLRLAKAMIYLPQMDEARRWLTQASKLRPNGHDLCRMMNLLNSRSQQNQLKDIEFARNIFQSQPADQGSSGQTEVVPDPDSNQTSVEDKTDANAANLEFDASFVSAEYKHDVEQVLIDFKNKCNNNNNSDENRELCLPYDGSDEAQHKMKHVEMRCAKLGLKFVPATAVSGPRITKL